MSHTVNQTSFEARSLRFGQMWESEESCLVMIAFLHSLTIPIVEQNATVLTHPKQNPQLAWIWKIRLMTSLSKKKLVFRFHSPGRTQTWELLTSMGIPLSQAPFTDQFQFSEDRSCQISILGNMPASKSPPA
jgi:hypothetical protein